MKTAVLCGGRGSRLRPLTDSVPKPLVKLNGTPILQRLVETYSSRGFRDFVFCLGYRGAMIREFFDSVTVPADLQFSDAGEDASILERLRLARPLLGDRFFVAYGDTLIDVDLKAMLAEHISRGASVTITTAEIRSPFGLVAVDGHGRVSSYEEKPLQRFYIGHMVMESRVVDDLPPGLSDLPDGEGLIRLFDGLLSRKELHSHHYGGPQITFNTRQELDQAQRDIVGFYTHEEELEAMSLGAENSR